MKYALAFAAALAVVAVICDSSIIRGADTRANLNLGSVSAGDRVLHSNQIIRYPGAANTIQSQDVIWNGNATNRITAIRATEQGYTQNATAHVIRGGIGWNNVTVRLQSARGRGFNYRLDIYGR